MAYFRAERLIIFSCIFALYSSTCSVVTSSCNRQGSEAYWTTRGLYRRRATAVHWCIYVFRKRALESHIALTRRLCFWSRRSYILFMLQLPLYSHSLPPPSTSNINLTWNSKYANISIYCISHVTEIPWQKANAYNKRRWFCQYPAAAKQDYSSPSMFSFIYRYESMQFGFIRARYRRSRYWCYGWQSTDVRWS